MVTREARYSREEFARGGGRRSTMGRVRSSLHPGDDGKFVAIDIESGIYEMDRDDDVATERLLSRQLGRGRSGWHKWEQRAADRPGCGSASGVLE